MNVFDSPLVFACAGDWLVGIVSVPEDPLETGVVVVVGGPQYRVGSHRQFALLARRLAAAGFPVLRFDCRGMGDSSGDPRSFEAIDEDIRAAIDALQRSVPKVRRVVLWGLCDGASASLLYAGAANDPRLHGLCLLNPWLRTEASQAATRVKHYYGQRLLQPQFWAKLLSGKIALAAFSDLIKNLRLLLPRNRQQKAFISDDFEPSYMERMAHAWSGFAGSILLLLSGKDYTALEFVELTRNDRLWDDALRHPRLQRHTILEADHTFSDASSAARVEEFTAAWLLRMDVGSVQLKTRMTNESITEMVTAHGQN